MNSKPLELNSAMFMAYAYFEQGDIDQGIEKFKEGARKSSKIAKGIYTQTWESLGKPKNVNPKFGQLRFLEPKFLNANRRVRIFKEYLKKQKIDTNIFHEIALAHFHFKNGNKVDSAMHTKNFCTRIRSLDKKRASAQIKKIKGCADKIKQIADYLRHEEPSLYTQSLQVITWTTVAALHVAASEINKAFPRSIVGKVANFLAEAVEYSLKDQG